MTSASVTSPAGPSADHRALWRPEVEELIYEPRPAEAGLSPSPPHGLSRLPAKAPGSRLPAPPWSRAEKSRHLAWLSGLTHSHPSTVICRFLQKRTSTSHSFMKASETHWTLLLLPVWKNPLGGELLKKLAPLFQKAPPDPRLQKRWG